MSSTGTPKSEAGLLSKAVPLSVLVAVAAMFTLAGNLDRAPAGDSMTQSAVAPMVTAAATAPIAANQAEIETIVRNYLLTNPEIIVEMQAAYEAKADEARAAMMKTALTTSADDIYRSTAPSTGNANGDVTVVEFFDYNCGFCRRALDGMTKVIESDKNVKVVLKELPIFGKESEDAAKVALAAKNQGKYWEVHQEMLQQPGKANKAKGLKIAKELGLDMVKLEQDLESPEVTGEIQRVANLAQKLGIQGTPHFLIDDQVIPGAPDDLFDQISSRIADVRKAGCRYC